MSNYTQTIQLTSKKLKKHILLATAVTVIGVLLTIVSAGAQGNGGRMTGVIIIIGGLTWVAVTKVRIWWHHK